MSWPENLYKPREHEQNCVGPCRSENSLSVRAMQLSIFGSMVCSIYIYLQRYVANLLLGIIAKNAQLWNFYIE
jgi:hypothetical protein